MFHLILDRNLTIGYNLRMIPEDFDTSYIERPKLNFKESIQDSEYDRLLRDYRNCKRESDNFSTLDFSQEERDIFRMYFISYGCYKNPFNDQVDFIARHPITEVESKIPLLNIIAQMYYFQQNLLRELHDGIETAASEASSHLGLSRNNWIKIAASRISSTYYENLKQDEVERQKLLKSEIRLIKRF